MKVDVSRNTFKRAHNFSRVLHQQGRVLIDADQNEQTSIFLDYLRTLAADLIGPHAGPGGNLGFEIIKYTSDGQHLKQFSIGDGRYYVDGMLVENAAEIVYPGDLSKMDPPFVIYLDAWERPITALEDPRIREVALGEADTCARAKVVWRVGVLSLDLADEERNCARFDKSAAWKKLLLELQPRPLLEARAHVDAAAATNPCTVPPDAGYRGMENQLYRVEIHHGERKDDATFKWSRDNGTRVFAIEAMSGNIVTVKHLGHDTRDGLEIGDWVEYADDRLAMLEGAPGFIPAQLLQVQDIDDTELTVTLSAGAGVSFDAGQHPLLRRWDGRLRNMSENEWLDLELGVQIRFAAGKTYRPGDYWLIPARTATGDVEEPKDTPVEPHGVRHYFAPLALAFVAGQAGTQGVIRVVDLRHTIQPVGACCPTVRVLNPPTVMNGATVTFIAVVNTAKSLRYFWQAEGGEIEGPTNTDSIVVRTGKGARTFVTATVIVSEAIEGGCVMTGSSSAVLLGP
ncbi:MAG: DUF6519 domain-containing protein [Acidobacteriota bacterium]